MVDPTALRPRLSTGLLFQMLYGSIIATVSEIPPFISVIPAYRIEMPALLFWHSHDKKTSPTGVSVRFNTGLENKMMLTSIHSKEHIARG